MPQIKGYTSLEINDFLIHSSLLFHPVTSSVWLPNPDYLQRYHNRVARPVVRISESRKGRSPSLPNPNEGELCFTGNNP